MKTFQEFLQEQSFVGFNVARASMPQIKINGFKKLLTRIGINFEQFVYNLDNVNPTQKDFDKWKVANIAMNIRKDPDSVKTMTPIIISNDNFVLDGHHRFYAAKREQVEVPVLVVDLPINKLLKLAIQYNEEIDV